MQQPPYPPQEPWQQQSPQQQPPIYNPQYSQQPYAPPLPPKKRRTWLWVVLGIIALVILGCIGASVLVTRTASTVVTTAATTVASTATTVAQPANAPKGTIGNPIVVNSDWTVTLNKVSTSQGSEFDKPKTGNVFLVVNVTLKNTSGSTQSASTLVQWALKDSTGQTYNQDIAYGGGPDGTVAQGGVIRGSIAYEVPKNVHSFILQFVPGLGSSDIAEWNVSI